MAEVDRDSEGVLLPRAPELRVGLGVEAMVLVLVGLPVPLWVGVPLEETVGDAVGVPLGVKLGVGVGERLTLGVSLKLPAHPAVVVGVGLEVRVPKR